MWVWPGCAFNSCGFSPFPNTLSVAWRTDTQRQVSGQLGRGLRACPPHVQAQPALAPLQSGPACPPAARCMWRSLCTRLPPPLTRPVSPALPLAPASRFRPVSLRLLSEGGVAQDSRRRVIFPGGLRRGLKGYPLVAVQQPSWEPLILWKERAGRGRKGRPCLVCCSAPCPAL